MRFPMIIPAILSHSVGIYDDHVTVVGIINNVGRFVVPFFFITSGYLLGRYNPPTLPAIFGTVQKLLPVFLFWLLLYIFLFNDLGNLAHTEFLTAALLRGEPTYHLWFFPALGLALSIILVLRYLGMKAMLGVSLSLYLFTLAFTPYKKFLHLSDYSPFLYQQLGAVIFVGIGYYLGFTKKIPTLKTAFAIFVCGASLQLSEAYFLLISGNGPFQPHLYLLGTPLLGLGVFAMAMHIRPFQGSKKLARVGRYAMGVYCIHPFFIRAIYSYYNPYDLWQVFFVSVYALLSSLIVVAVMIRLPMLKHLVR